MTVVEITNIDEVFRLFAEMPKEQDKVLSKGNVSFLKRVRRSAKLMAPRDTGFLASTIKIRPTKTKGKTKQYLLEVSAPYANLQEEGFTPHYAFIRNSSKLAPGVYFVKKNTPFVKPAIEKNIGRFFQEIEAGIKGSITK